jgi:glycerol-1-phosphate dehydrogenase [NAD(P)+]
MTIRGTKVSYPSRPPIALYADPAVFADAPERLTASGVGDLLGKYICLADWKIARILTGEEICPELMALEYAVIEELEAVIAAAGDAVKTPGDAHTEYVCRVMEGLVLSGLAIQLNGNSRPASGAEHHLSHFWEMARINEDIPALHGEQVGIAALFLLDYYKKAAERFASPFMYDPDTLFSREKLEPVYRELTDDILLENMPKGISSCSLADISADAPVQKADAIREVIASLPSHETLFTEMKLCGCKTTLAEINLPETVEFLTQSLRFAPYARNRLTFLKYLEAQNLI